MTCKDCIHCEICDVYSKMGVTDIPADDITICKLFKDKSKFFELPCKVGNKVYFVVNDRVQKNDFG